MTWSWRPWRRGLVTPHEQARSQRALQEAPELAERARRATADLIVVTRPNHLGERYHRALTGR